MTTRSFILAVGFTVAAIVCFFPPAHDVRDPKQGEPNSFGEYRTVAAPDYPGLFLRLGGILCLTGAVWAIAGPKRRVVVDATPKERSVAR